MQYRIQQLEFQSTPLIRGETMLDVFACIEAFISIRSPHARGDRR